MSAKAVISRRYPDQHTVEVAVAGQKLQQTLRSRHEQFCFEARGLKQAQFDFRLFRPGSGVLDVLLDDLFRRAHAGETEARLQYVTLIVEQYLPKPTYRRLSPDALERAHLTSGGSASAVTAFEDAVVGELSDDEDVENALMQALVGQTCEEATTKLPLVREARRALLKHIPPLDWDGFAKIKAAGIKCDPNRFTDAEKPLRHSIRQAVRRCLPKDPALQQLTGLYLQRVHQSLLDQANRLILTAMRSQLRMTQAEIRAFKFYHLKRQQPIRPIEGLWFDGTVSDHAFLDGLLAMCPAGFRRLAVTTFFRAWPKSTQLPAERELRRYLCALLKAGDKFLQWVREEERDIKAEKASRRPRDKALTKLAAKSQQLADLQMHRSHLTSKQQEVVELRDQGLTTEEIGKQLGITRQAVEKRLRDAMSRIKRRRS